MGFQGVDKGGNILLNIANIEHKSDEADRKNMNSIKYNWELK